MLKAHRLYIENKLIVVYRPAVGNFFVLFPVSAALVTAVIPCVCRVPEGIFLFRRPDNLRVGTNQNYIAPTFKTFTVRGINKLVILPVFL